MTSQRKPVTALLDLCVHHRTVTVRPTTKQQTVRWSGKTITAPVHGFTRERLPGPNEAWLQEQIEALPTVTRLAREGAIRLFRYIEFELEGLKGKLGLRGLIGDLLNDVPIDDVPAAIERSNFQQPSNFEKHADKERLIEFCELLLSPNFDPDQVCRLPLRFTDFELENLRLLKRFREIRRALDRNHYPDAFHLWTAETNRLNYFLTTDKKFINLMTHTSKTQGPTRVISPADLLRELGVTEWDPLPVNESFHYLHELR